MKVIRCDEKGCDVEIDNMGRTDWEPYKLLEGWGTFTIIRDGTTEGKVGLEFCPEHCPKKADGKVYGEAHDTLEEILRDWIYEENQAAIENN
ncbi:MAG: hypothetical protein V3R78_12525 [Thermodesulfobacteriota bacterium]